MCGIAIMFGTGGSAIIGRKLGEEKREEANENFSLVTLSAVVIGSLFTLFVFLYMMPVMRLLGASDRLMSYCIDYGEIIYAFAVPYILQVMFNTLFITAGKPKLALAASVISGLMNIFLDYVFIVPLEMGIGGAAWGTAISRLFGGVFPIVYFLKKEKTCILKNRNSIGMLSEIPWEMVRQRWFHRLQPELRHCYLISQ